MRTTLDLDRDLLDRAKSALGVPTFTAAIEAALNQAIERAEMGALLDSLEGSDVVFGLEDLRTMRQVGRGHTP